MPEQRPWTEQEQLMMSERCPTCAYPLKKGMTCWRCQKMRSSVIGLQHPREYTGVQACPPNLSKPELVEYRMHEHDERRRHWRKTHFDIMTEIFRHVENRGARAVLASEFTRKMELLGPRLVSPTFDKQRFIECVMSENATWDGLKWEVPRE